MGKKDAPGMSRSGASSTGRKDLGVAMPRRSGWQICPTVAVAERTHPDRDVAELRRREPNVALPHYGSEIVAAETATANEKITPPKWPPEEHKGLLRCTPKEACLAESFSRVSDRRRSNNVCPRPRFELGARITLRGPCSRVPVRRRALSLRRSHLSHHFWSGCTVSVVREWI
jgi:hypothetical protein